MKDIQAKIESAGVIVLVGCMAGRRGRPSALHTHSG